MNSNTLLNMEAMLKQQREKEDLAKAELQGLLENYTPVVDWTPLAAQLDAMAGGDIAKTAAQSSLARGLESEKRMGDLIGKKQATDELMKEKAKQDEIEKRSLRAHEARLGSEIRKAKSKLDSEAANLEPDYAVLEAAFTPNERGMYDLNKINSTLSNYARSVGGEKGALAEGDVNRAMYLSDLETMFERVKRKLGGRAEVPYELIAPYVEQLQVSKIARTNALKNKLETVRQSFAEDPTYAGMFETPDSYGVKVFDKSIENLRGSSGIKPLVRKRESDKEEKKKVEPNKEAQKASLKKEATAEDILKMLQSAPNQ